MQKGKIIVGSVFIIIGGAIVYSLYTDNLLCGLGDDSLAFRNPPCDLPLSYVMPAIAVSIGILLVVIGFRSKRLMSSKSHAEGGLSVTQT